MQIAELYRNQACLEDLTAELPDGIEYDRCSESLLVTEPFDEAASWGPFRFELVRSPEAAHLSVRTSDSRTQPGDRLFVRLKVKSERWLMLLDFADTDAASSSETADDGETEACNTAIVVNVRQQTLYLKAQRPLVPGERLRARLSSSGSGEDGDDELAFRGQVDSEREADARSDTDANQDDNFEIDDNNEGTAADQPMAQPSLSRPAAVRKRPASADDVCSSGGRGGVGGSAKLPRLQSGGRRSAAQAEASLRSRIRYCSRCGLFFTSAWMLQTHRQFHDLFDAPRLQSDDGSPQLVLSAPVLSDRGSIAYVPVNLPMVQVQLSESQQQQQQEQLQQTVSESDMDGSSPDMSEATALDLTLPRAPTPELAAAASAPSMRSHPQSRQRVRQSQQQLGQQLQLEQQQPRKSGSGSSLMSVCKDCKIGFFNYNNYVVHRSLYCQSSRLAGAPAASDTPGRGQKLPLQQQQQQPPLQLQEPHQQPKQLPTAPQPPAAALATPKLEALATPATPTPLPAAAVSASSPTAASTERKFQCPYCQIRFHSPSTLTAHQAFYCPDNPDKTAPASASGTIAASAAAAPAAVSTAPSAADAAAAAVTGDTPGPLQQQQQQQQQHPPTWLPISLDLSGSAGYKCSICGYIGQTERGMKMHAKVHSGFGACLGVASGNGGAATSAALSPSDASSVDGGIRLPSSFSSDLLSSMTPEELGMLQHKTQPYSKRRTFKRMTPLPQSLPQHTQQQLQLPLSLHPSLLRHQLQQLQQQQQAISAGAAAAAATSAANFRLTHRRRDSGDDTAQWPTKQHGQLVCVRCAEPFDQLESLLEHQETACPGLNAAAVAAAAAVEAAAAAVKLESVRTADSLGRV